MIGPPSEGRVGDRQPAETKWRTLVERVLRGAAFETLCSRTEDDIPVEPLYTRESVRGTEGVPGGAPLLRGAHAAGNLCAGWQIRTLERHPDPARAAVEIEEDLARGAHGIELRIELAPGGLAELPRGVVVVALDDLSAALEPFDPQRHTLAVDAPASPATAALVQGWLKRRGIEAPGPWLVLGMDPLGAAATGGAESAAAASIEFASLLPELANRFAGCRFLRISGLPYHEAGATPAQELAAVVATAIVYLRLADDAGIAPTRALGAMELQLAADADILSTACKLRTARRLVAQVAASCGAGHVAPPVHATSSVRMLTRVDPWTNLLRNTAACIGAALGGADAVTVLPFDHLLGLPDALSRRLARNTQLVLALESGLNRPIDPLGGSFFAHRFADELATRAWTVLQRIETAGGMVRALDDGLVQSWVAQAALDRDRRAASRQDILVGVSAFIDLSEARREPASFDRTALDIRLERARRHTVDPARMTFAELVGALVEGRGLPARVAAVPRIPVLAPRRPAEMFERLRARSDAILGRAGRRPTLLLCCLGAPAQHVEPSGFARNLFEAGGIRVIEHAEAQAPAEAVAAFAAGGADYAALCGVGEDGDATLARALREAGAKRVFRIGATEDAAAFDAVLEDGVDAVSLLEDCYRALGDEPS